MSLQLPPRPLQDTLSYWIIRLAQAVDHLYIYYLQGRSESRAQLWALQAIHMGAVCPTELAKAIGVERSAITRLTTRLEKTGYLIRSRSGFDRRGVTLALTEKAERALPVMESAVHRIDRMAAHGLHESEQATLRALNRRMLENLSEYE